MNGNSFIYGSQYTNVSLTYLAFFANLVVMLVQLSDYGKCYYTHTSHPIPDSLHKVHQSLKAIQYKLLSISIQCQEKNTIFRAIAAYPDPSMGKLFIDCHTVKAKCIGICCMNNNRSDVSSDKYTIILKSMRFFWFKHYGILKFTKFRVIANVELWT